MELPRSVSRLLAIIVAVLVLAAIVFGIRHRKASTESSSRNVSPSERPSSGKPASGTSPNPAANPSSDDPSREPPPIPIHPVSAWLAAPANPIGVSVQIAPGRTDQGRLTPGGGELSLSTKEGTRVTLSVPADALLNSQELKLELVETVSEAPFAGGIVAAVRITPETLALRKFATLTFESRQPIEDTQPLAGFAVRDGRELHLVRADRSLDPKLRGRARVGLPLVRLGTYGVAKASAEELSAAGQHEPTDYLARLEQRVARAFVPVGARARMGRSWSLIPLVHAQGGIFPVDDLMHSLETFFDEVVVPQFANIPKEGCNFYPTIYAERVYNSWWAMANLLLPLRPIPNALPDVLELEARLREQRRAKLHDYGYSDEDISFIDSMFEKYRDKIDELVDKANGLIDEALTRQFANAYRCCLSDQTRAYYLDGMVESMRMAALRSVTVDPDAMTKVMECNCRVATGAVESGGGEYLPAAGTITHTETFEGTRIQNLGAGDGSRTTTETISMSYKQTLILVQNRGHKRYGAKYDVTGSVRTNNELWDHKSCGEVGGYLKRSGSGRDDGSQQIAIEPVVNSPRKYRISYFPQWVKGPGVETGHWEAKGCQLFNNVRDDPARDITVDVGSVPQEVVIETEADPAHPTELRGTKDLEISGGDYVKIYEKPRKVKVEWHLQLCPQ